MKCKSPLEKARLIHLMDKNLNRQSAEIDCRYCKVIYAIKCQPELFFFVNGIKYKRRFVYDKYAASKCAKIINIRKQKLLTGNILSTVYFAVFG